MALTVALINASSGLTALWVLLAGAGYVLFICFPVRLAYRWIAKKSGSLDTGVPSATMITITVVLVFVSGFYTDIIGIHAIFVSFDNTIRIKVLTYTWTGWFPRGSYHTQRQWLRDRARGETRRSRVDSLPASGRFLPLNTPVGII